MRAIHQILPSFQTKDAMGNEVLTLRSVLLSKGFKSEIFTISHLPELRGLAKPYQEYHKISSKDNVLIYHFGIGSPLTEFILKIPDRVILRYHNITPSRFLEYFEPTTAKICRQGRDQLKVLRQKAIAAFAVSHFNAQELRAYGFKNISVIPIIKDFKKMNKPDASIVKRFNRDGTKILFVGRVISNKKQEDVIKAFYLYKKYYDSSAHLFLVGGYINQQKHSYSTYLKALITKLNLKDVFLTGTVSERELSAYYQIADIFVCMSEHEGFCVPLLEAMNYKIPIIAYDQPGVAETCGNASIIVKNKNFAEIAEWIDTIIKNKELKEEIIRRQNKRLSDFDYKHISKSFLEHLKEFVK